MSKLCGLNAVLNELEIVGACPVRILLDIYWGFSFFSDPDYTDFRSSQSLRKDARNSFMAILMGPKHGLREDFSMRCIYMIA